MKIKKVVLPDIKKIKRICVRLTRLEAAAIEKFSMQKGFENISQLVRYYIMLEIENNKTQKIMKRQQTSQNTEKEN